MANYDHNFTSRTITVTEIWGDSYGSETKQQSIQWKNQQSPRPEKAWQIWSVTKSMLIIFSMSRASFTENSSRHCHKL